MEGAMSESVVSVLEKERARLNKQRDQVLARREKLDEEIARIDKELGAITAYEAAKQGKPKRAASKRDPRGSRQQSILEVIAKHTKGITRGEILEAMNFKGNKAGEQSVSNALSALKKAKRIVSKDRKYFVG
jgi:TFIIF-interacting CTD phosphatase-like protein